MVLLVVLVVFIGFALAVLWRPASVIALAFCVYPFEQWAQAKSVYFQTNSTIINYGMGDGGIAGRCRGLPAGQEPFPSDDACHLDSTGIVCVCCRELSLVGGTGRIAFSFKYHLPYMC